MKSYQGIVIKKTLEHWRPLLKEWISLMEKYCSEIWDDPIYCHEERANVSLLASAAWRIDWLAVQELWVERLSGGSTFCDLWLRPNSTKAGRPGFGQKLGKNARKQVEANFSLERLGKEINEIYAELSGSRRL